MFAPYDYRREAASQTDRSKLFFTFINSTALYILAYVVLYTLFEIITSNTAWIGFNIKSIIFYHKIDFRVSADVWNPQNVITTFTAGPVFCLIMSWVFFRLYKLTKKQPGYLKLLFFWLYLHGVNFFFGFYVAGVITSTNFHWVTNYLRVTRKIEYVIAFVCVLVQFAIGYFSTKGFLQMSPSKNLIERYNRRLFIFCVCIGPWMVGSIVLTVFKLPNILIHEMLVYLMMFTFAVPVVLIQRSFLEVMLVRQIKALAFSWPFILGCIGALILFRSIFQFGLKVGN